MVDTAEKITRAIGKGYDAQRRALLPSGSVLTLISHADGVVDADVALLTSGWFALQARRRAGKVETGLRVDIVETALATLPGPVIGPLTEAIIESAHRLTYFIGGPTFVITNFDTPTDAPRQWTLWCEELIVGSIQ